MCWLKFENKLCGVYDLRSKRSVSVTNLGAAIGFRFTALYLRSSPITSSYCGRGAETLYIPQMLESSQNNPTFIASAWLALPSLTFALPLGPFLSG